MDEEVKRCSTEFGIHLSVHRFAHLNQVIFPRTNRIPLALFIFLLPVLFLEQCLIYYVGLVPSQFYSVILQKDVDFYRVLVVAVSLIIAIAVVKGVRWFVQQQLKIGWCQLLYHFLHHMYFLHAHYYKLCMPGHRVHNADEIITQDVEKFCTQYSEVIAEIITLPFVVVFYTYITCTNLGCIGLVSLYGFVAFGKITSVCVMYPIIRWSELCERQMTKFRLHHIHIHANSESLAFCDSTQVEYLKAREELDKLISTEQQLCCLKLAWNFTVSLLDCFGSALSYILLFLPIYEGLYNNYNAIQISVLISKNSFFVIYLISVLSSLMALRGKVSDLAETTHRLSELIEQLEQLMKGADVEIRCRSLIGRSRIWKMDFYGWSLENVTVTVPHTDHVLIEDLTLKILAGNNLLIFGNSLSGKSSFLRVLHGLWNVNQGKITCNIPDGPSGVVYIPQKPVFVSGCLREQIVYPLKVMDNEDTADDQTLLELLHLLDLEILLFQLGGLDAVVPWNWLETLSASEMQRLIFLQVLYHCPVFAVADEPTCAMSSRYEEIILQKCSDLNITNITAARSGTTLTRFHTAVLSLDGSGGWSIEHLQVNH